MNIKRTIVGIVGALVLITVFLTIFTDYFTVKYGIITAIAILILGGIIAKIWGIKE